VKFVFYHSKLRKQPLFAKNSRGERPPPTPMLRAGFSILIWLSVDLQGLCDGPDCEKTKSMGEEC